MRSPRPGVVGLAMVRPCIPRARPRRRDRGPRTSRGVRDGHPRGRCGRGAAIVSVTAWTPRPASTQLSQRFRELNPWVLDACIGTAFTVFGLHRPVQRIRARRRRTATPTRSRSCSRSSRSLPYFARRRAPVDGARRRTSSRSARSAIIGYPFNVQAQMVLVGIYTVGSHCDAARPRASGSDRGRRSGSSPSRRSGSRTRPAPTCSSPARSTPAPTSSVRRCGTAASTSASSRRGDRVLERERGRARRKRAVADERLRIAQELHDVVAHSMGVIAVQAGRRRARHRPGPGRGEALARGDRRDQPVDAHRDPPDPRRAAQRRRRRRTNRRPGSPTSTASSATSRTRACRSRSRSRARRRAAARRRPHRVPHRAGGADQRAQARGPGARVA